MGILGALLLVGFVLYLFSQSKEQVQEAVHETRREAIAVQSEALANQRRELENDRDEQEKRDDWRRYIALQIRVDKDQKFADRIYDSRPMEVVAEEQEANPAAWEAKSRAIKEEAHAWFLSLSPSDQRLHRAEYFASRRKKALERVNDNRAAEREQMMDFARRMRDHEWGERQGEVFREAMKAGDDEALRVSAEQTKREAKDWFNGLPDEEKSRIESEHKSPPRQWARQLAEESGLPHGLTVEDLGRFMARARDEIEYRDAERWLGYGDTMTPLDNLNYRFADAWEELDGRRPTEVLAEPHGDEKIMRVLIEQLDQGAETARQMGL